MTLEWSDSLASGSSEIDTQHKELIGRVNSLLHAVDAGTTAREEVARTVQYLTEYVVLHFGNEEKYMAQYQYSSAAAHKAQHEQFVKIFEKLKERLLREGISAPLARELRDLCTDWLVNHIKFSDRALGMYLKMKT